MQSFIQVTQINKTPGLNNSQSNKLFFQPKISINQPNDIYEQEADAMADKVMRMKDDRIAQASFFKPSTINIQRKCAHCDEEEKQMQRKEINDDNVAANASTENYISSLSGKGRSLSKNEKSFFEPRFGYDFSNVQLHTNAEANQSAKNINALAYTHGDNIVFGANQYKPNTESGKQLLAHELTHVVQQKNMMKHNALQRKFDFTQPTPQKIVNPVSVKCNQDKGSTDQEKISLGLTKALINNNLNSTVGDMKRLINLRVEGKEDSPGNFSCNAVSTGSVPVSAREWVLTAPNASGKWTGTFPDYPEQSCKDKTNIPVTIKGDPDAATIEKKVLDNENEHVSDIEQACTDMNAQLDTMFAVTGHGTNPNGSDCTADLIRKIGKGPDPINAIGTALIDRIKADIIRRDSGSHTLPSSRSIGLNCSSLTFTYKI